jgi:hypothetical protein
MDTLERELHLGLREVSAPAELWDRIQAPWAAHSDTYSALHSRPQHGLLWAMAATVMLVAVGFSIVYAGVHARWERVALDRDSAKMAFRCENPAQLRAWVLAKTGLDLPLRPIASGSIQLIGAQVTDDSRGVEVAYRAGNRDAIMRVSRADAGAANVSHNRVSGNVSSWVMDGQRYILACNDPASLQLACKLCHLD